MSTKANSPPDPRVLLIWTKSCEFSMSFLSANITREVCLYLSPLYAVSVSNHLLVYFGKHRRELLPPIYLWASVQFSDSRRWAVIGK